MANEREASIIQLRKRPMTDAQRAKNYRDRKRAAKLLAALQGRDQPRLEPQMPVTAVVRTSPSRASSRSVTSIAVTLAAFALAGVGITMNGWFARSLGASDIAGLLFLAIGVAADGVALAIPACCARLWQARQRLIAAVGWLVWLMTFIFAVTSGIGFASLNISDVTEKRASRVTPAVVTAQNALTDAMTARDRECHGGVGKFCREREAAVADRRAALDGAMKAVAVSADPQTLAAIHVVAWLSNGALTPNADDFATLRLVLLALLPQIGGILLMIGRAK